MSTATTRPQYVIEHMEEDEPDAPSVLPQWALLEYRHMLQLVGPGSTVHFTSLSHASLESLRSLLSQPSGQSGCRFELHTASITTLMAERRIAKSAVCLLDPRSRHALSITDAGKHTSDCKPDEAGGPFEYFLFGGILGDDPPRDRTGSLRQLAFPSRHLGGVQMTTDTALGVTKKCVQDGFLLGLNDTKQQESAWGDTAKAKGQMQWLDHPELQFGRGESVEMPFRYMVDQARGSDRKGNKQPLMPEGMRELIRNDLYSSLHF